MTSTNSNDATTSLSGLVSPLPDFWQHAPELYFFHIEATFHSAKITRETDKYYKLVEVLPPTILSQVPTILRDPPTDAPYTKLKAELLRLTPVSDRQRYHALVKEEALGDRKPSELLRCMRSLVGNMAIDDKFLKEMFLERLLMSVQTILASGPDDLDISKPAEMADRTMEVERLSSPTIAQVSQPLTVSTSDLTELKTQIARLSATAAALHLRRSPDPSRRSFRRDRRRSRSRPRTANLCWHHVNYGDKARRCVPPCSFKFTQGNSSAEEQMRPSSLATLRTQTAFGLFPQRLPPFGTFHSLRTAADPENWTDHLPLVLLGIRSALKPNLDCSAAELVFGATVRLPDVISPTPSGAVEDPTNFLHRLRQFMRTLSPVPPRSSASPSYLEKDLETCSHVHLRCDRVRQPLEPPYDGPFRVLSRVTKTFGIRRDNREEVVSVGGLKAAVPDTLPDEPCGPLHSALPPAASIPPSCIFSLPSCPLPPTATTNSNTSATRCIHSSTDPVVLSLAFATWRLDSGLAGTGCGKTEGMERPAHRPLTTSVLANHNQQTPTQTSLLGKQEISYPLLGSVYLDEQSTSKATVFVHSYHLLFTTHTRSLLQSLVPSSFLQLLRRNAVE
ncbi:hypothetical protein SprV_0401481900 [Sparganum proliferum]